MNYPKRLIEVDLPIKRISAHARREKSIRQGHISTLHIWWARRPLAACRAVICASLWFDPADERCPVNFRQAARKQMQKWGQDDRGLMSVETYLRFETATKRPELYEDNEMLRSLLLDFIADFANWDNSANEEYLKTSRALTEAAHLANGGEIGTRPLIVDPFSGGGAIPLEALRVGADAFASDLNPVAVLLNKVVLEYIPRYGQKLANEVRKWAEWVKEEAEKELTELYPKDANGTTPIAYLWARTIICEGPGCGAELPMMRSTWLSRKRHASIALIIKPDFINRAIEFDISGNSELNDGSKGTVRRGGVTCPICGYTTEVRSVRKQLKIRNGGTADARMLAIRTSDRTYRLPTEVDLKAVRKAHTLLNELQGRTLNNLTCLPSEPTPSNDGHRAVGSPWIYGMYRWRDLFTPRQLCALAVFRQKIDEVGARLDQSDSSGLNDAILSLLAIAASRLSDFSSSLCTLNYTGGRGVAHTFDRHALQMVWDFAESNPFNKAAANWDASINAIIDTARHENVISTQGHVARADATKHLLPNDSAQMFITDPPYYDAVAYADLADYFYVGLRRNLIKIFPDLFAEDLTPKKEQAVVLHPNSIAERTSFELKMSKAMAEGRRILSPSGIGLVVFAHKSTVGWESQLGAMIEAGWTITASWAIDTERSSRINAQDTASLASSIHLVCRPRENESGLLNETIGDWRDILRELPIRIHEWMPRLAKEGVVGADAIFACLGPALEIFSRYSSVEKPNGDPVKLGEYLEYVWAGVAKEALDMIFSGANATGFEEDARLSAMWLWTLFAGSTTREKEADDEDTDNNGASGKAKKIRGYVLEYDAARKIAQGLGAHLEDLSSIVEVKGDKATLLSVTERARDLFGSEESSATEVKRKNKAQKSLFAEMDEVESGTGFSVKGKPDAGSTTLDRVHQSMLLFGAGRGEAVRRFLVDDGVGNDERFWRLANALSALYPTGTDEKRWVDGVLARKKGMGF